MDNKNVEEYYDDFIKYQVKAGINDRIHQLFNRLLHLGLNADSNILELGSGIGVLSFLLSKKVKSGKIEAVDLSSKSIEFSRHKIKNKNISFSRKILPGMHLRIKNLILLPYLILLNIYR